MTNYLQTAVDAYLTMIAADVTAEAAFIASAMATADARDNGVSAPKIAAGMKAASKGATLATGAVAYGSPESVGLHAAAGRVFRLPGQVVGLAPRDAQKIIKAARLVLGSTPVDVLVGLATEAGAVLSDLEARTEAAKAAKAAEEAAATEAAEAAAKADRKAARDADAPADADAEPSTLVEDVKRPATLSDVLRIAGQMIADGAVPTAEDVALVTALFESVALVASNA